MSFSRGRQLSPLPVDVLRTGIVLEHQAAAVDGLVIPAPAPICINLFKLTTPPALLDMEVNRSIAQIDGSAATVTPNNSEVRGIDLNIKRHE